MQPDSRLRPQFQRPPHKAGEDLGYEDDEPDYTWLQ